MELNEKTEIEESIPKGYWKSKVGVIPNDWDIEAIGSLTKPIKNPVLVDLKEEYVQLGIRSHGKGIFYKEKVTGEELGNKRVFWVEPNCFIVNIVFAWERAIARTTDNDKGIIASHRFPMYKPIEGKIELDYLTYFFKSKRGGHILELASPGGAGRNKTLGQSNFAKSLVPVPTLKEQQNIAKMLLCQDEIIKLKKHLLNEKLKQKKYLMQKFLNPEDKRFERLKGFDEAWREVLLGDIINTVPTKKYQIFNKDYVRLGRNPVIDQGNKYIAAYSNKDNVFDDVPVIAFGDHTTNLKYIDFPFIVGADGVKLIQSKKDVNTKFLYYVMLLNNVKQEGYKRHFSKLRSSKVWITLDYSEQNQIVKLLTVIDKNIDLLTNEVEQEIEKKKVLMQLLLTGKVRTTNMS